MRPISDWRALCLLVERGPESLEPYVVYKACVSFAINGRAHDVEATLAPPYRALLDARRALKLGELAAARALLEGFAPGAERAHELLGDRAFLLGLLAHRKGDPALAERRLDDAIAAYRHGADEHRTLRAIVNRAICRSTLETYRTGELFFLKQRASSEGFHDLVGNIEKAAVTELLLAGEHAEAAETAARAIAAYEKDGCPEDRAVAQAHLAISLWLDGRKDEALRAESSLPIRDGKVESYAAILAALVAGRTPGLPAGHPLAALAWQSAAGPRESSVPGRILGRLKEGSAERDELICAVWGEKALHASYAGRLYTAIKELRRKYRVPVEFDGARYRLAGR